MALPHLVVFTSLVASALAATLPGLTRRVSNPVPFGWTYAGCKVDVGDRIIVDAHIMDALAMTPQYCVTACAGLGYILAGVEYGSECWCGNTYNSLVAAPAPATESDCSFTCPGDSNQTCGAGWRIQVYNAYETGKRGLGWPSDNTFDPEIFKSPKITWLFEWGRVNPIKNKYFPFYIQQWDTAYIDTPETAAVSTGARTVLAFNEPDNPYQASMEPDVAASYYKQYIHPLSDRGYHLIAPAITNGLAPAGFVWLDASIAVCDGCKIDGIGLHWYGGWTDDLISFIESAKKYNKPLYLSEFALSWDAAASDYAEFLPLALQYLDNEAAVAKYAFFGAFHSGGGWDMIAADSSLTDLGRIYLS